MNNDDSDDNAPGCTLRELSVMLDSSDARNAKLDRAAAANSETHHREQKPHATFEQSYQKDRRLRSGSYGTVYTCHHKHHNQETIYAVKIMDRTKLKSKDVDAVFREAKILNELTRNHDSDVPLHVIQLIDFYVEPNALYMVQVFAAGGDVFDRLTSRKQYTEADVRDLAHNLLSTINFLHHHKPHPIVHRDLKPENLLLVDTVNDTQILLADFGFARHIDLDNGDYCHTRCGSPAFVSPEILLGVPYGRSVDLWSIGCLLYMLVAGYPPFAAPHHRALFRKIRAGDFILHESHWRTVSVEAKQLIVHLLTVNATKRWTAEQALACDWFVKAQPERLEGHDLTGALVELERFNPKHAWKRAFNALGFCATATFWKPDALSFTRQLKEWDSEAVAKAAADMQATAAGGTSSSGGSAGGTSASMNAKSTAAMLMNKLPKLQFSDNYDMVRKLRKGSHAMVWMCTHKEKGGEFAVKVIERKGLEPKDDEAVLNEVAVMQSLAGNEYVVHLLDFYEEETHFYMVMEYMAGGDVFDRVVQYTHYTEEDARELAITLLRTVASIHRAGLAHRDIKPQNLLLKSESNNADIRVGDFGFARRIHTPESLTSRVGTPTYVAPEVLKNIPHDERVDLWSVGVVIFVLLVGYPPFLDENQTNLFQKIRTGEWVFYEEDWQHISKDAKDLIEGLLVVDPNDRWTMEECLRSKWIHKEASMLSTVDLSDSLDTMRTKNTGLRGLARAFKGLGDKVKPFDVVTQAQAQASMVSKVSS